MENEGGFYAQSEKFLKRIKPNYQLERVGFGGVAEAIQTDELQQALFNQICQNLGAEGLMVDVPSDNASRLNVMVGLETKAGFGLATPVGFEQPKRELLREIRQQGGPDAYESAKAAMEMLEHNIYGKQYEYFQALERIRAETPMRLGWAVLSSEKPEDEYDETVKARIEAHEKQEREASPEYQQAFAYGAELARQMRAAMEQNPQYADAIRRGYESVSKAAPQGGGMFGA